MFLSSTEPSQILDFDMGWPSVCYEYSVLPLVNKEAVLAYGSAEILRQEIQADIEEERRQSHPNTM